MYLQIMKKKRKITNKHTLNVQIRVASLKEFLLIKKKSKIKKKLKKLKDICSKRTNLVNQKNE